MGFIDNTGRVVIKPQDKFVVPDWGTYPEFVEGLAQIEVEMDDLNPGRLTHKKKIGFIDTTGKVVIEPQPLQSAYEFSEGLAMVGRDYHYGFIDKTGRLVIPFRWQSARSFSGGWPRSA